ncbi:MAG TPA: sulfatase-like hydrolase/transferase [Longimicrobiaceae bacterium]|nr:sulfatase-like hydrolase/transferase [Longimicrobiaceae bacterium]
MRYAVRLLLGSLFVPLAVSGARAQAPRAAAQRPNVVYIVLDDVGFSDLGAYGSEIRTPNIDQLARDGIRYNVFETRAVCSPTRAALLTGRNNQSVGMLELPSADLGRPQTRGHIVPEAATIAQVLRANGYATSAVGKWHLTPPAEMADSTHSRANWPSGKGFQNFYGWLMGWTDQYDPSGVGREMMEGDHPSTAPRPPGYHVSEAIVTRAIDYLKEGWARDPRRPQFLYVAFGAGHYPLQVPEEYIDGYDGVYEVGWDRLREERFERQKHLGIVPGDARLSPRGDENPAWGSLSADEKKVYARFMATYAGFLEHADEQIGRLVAYLKRSGHYDDTLIFLISDNGATPEGGPTGQFRVRYHRAADVGQLLARLDEVGSRTSEPMYQRPWAWLGATPFQKYKSTPYGGGVRDPLIVTWPAVIRDRGAIRTQFVDAIDITPTVLDVLGIEPPAVVDGVPQMPMHGRSIRGTFTDPDAPTRSVQYFEIYGNRAIRSGGWRAIATHENGTSFDEDRWELYDLNHDFSESTDVAARYPEKLKELQALWWSEAAKYDGLPILESRRGYRGDRGRYPYRRATSGSGSNRLPDRRPRRSSSTTPNGASHAPFPSRGPRSRARRAPAHRHRAEGGVAGEPGGGAEDLRGASGLQLHGVGRRELHAARPARLQRLRGQDAGGVARAPGPDPGSLPRERLRPLPRQARADALQGAGGGPARDGRRRHAEADLGGVRAVGPRVQLRVHALPSQRAAGARAGLPPPQQPER